jgi:hypothetical protein
MIGFGTMALGAALVFLFVMIGLEVGRRLAMRKRALDSEGAPSSLGAIDGAVFGLLGLVIAFTFSGGLTRFEARRELVTREANAIGTAWLRIDLLPAKDREGLRELFRAYLDSRLATYRSAGDPAIWKAEYARSAALQTQIWGAATAAIQEAPTPPVTLIVPALNEMFDITTTRLMATQNHPPVVVYVMLFALILASSLLAGHAMGKGAWRNWLHMLAFALVISITVYVILDVEFPRLGLIRVDSADEILVDLRKSFG